jgi:hypothetical protein
MSKSALLDVIQDSRRKLVYHEEDGKTYVETRQDVEPIIKAAKLIADQPPGKDFRHAAFIPESELNRAFVEGWFHDRAAWKRWANDPANACYRTWPGRL